MEITSFVLKQQLHHHGWKKKKTPSKSIAKEVTSPNTGTEHIIFIH